MSSAKSSSILMVSHVGLLRGREIFPPVVFFMNSL
jgi:hypothetical protein